MADLYKRLHFVSALILEEAPAEINSEFQGIFPSVERALNLADKFNLYYFVDNVRQYVPEKNRPLLGEFMSIVDKLAA